MRVNQSSLPPSLSPATLFFFNGGANMVSLEPTYVATAEKNHNNHNSNRRAFSVAAHSVPLSCLGIIMHASASH